MERTLASDIRMGRRVTLRDLQVLLAVAQFGSMAKAASQLSITQPAVSQAVANLERAFGARLVDRGPHGAVLTSYGVAIQRRGMEVFDVLKQGSREIEYLSDAGTGDVWIGANEVLLGGFVPAVVQRLAEQHPNITVHALTINSADFDFEKLRERELDLLLGRIVPKSKTTCTLRHCSRKGCRWSSVKARPGPGSGKWHSQNWQSRPGYSPSQTMSSGLTCPRYSATMVWTLRGSA